MIFFSLQDYCLPTFIENLNASNCLNMWVYAYKLNFDELKTAAFKTLDENWKMHQNSSEFLEMMKSAPNAVSFFLFFGKIYLLFDKEVVEEI